MSKTIAVYRFADMQINILRAMMPTNTYHYSLIEMIQQVNVILASSVTEAQSAAPDQM